MDQRINPFANLESDPPVFHVKPKKQTAVAPEAIERIAQDHGFPSRQAPRSQKEPKRKPRLYTTGRNQQFTCKATAETIERFYKIAEDRKIKPLCKLLELALDALEKEQ